MPLLKNYMQYVNGKNVKIFSQKIAKAFYRWNDVFAVFKYIMYSPCGIYWREIVPGEPGRPLSPL